MAKPREHLSNAPIAEAILDFRVEPREDFELAELDSLAEAVAKGYPTRAPLMRMHVAIASGSPGPPQVSRADSRDGVLLRSDRNTVAQLRGSGLTFSQLRPYTRWEEVAAEAISLWEQYADAARPRRLTRLAVRYINDMGLPADQPARYLARPPALPPKVPRLVREFISRVVVWDQARLASAVIVQAMPPQAGGDVMRLLLDIDASREGDLPMDVQSCRTILGVLRELKNTIFFASVTEEALRHFQ